MLGWHPAPPPTSLPRFWASGPLGGPLLTPFPFKAGESLLGRCVLQGSLGQEKCWGGGYLGAHSKEGVALRNPKLEQP